MKRSSLVVAVLVLGALGVACGKKDQDPQSIPVGSASAASTVAAEPPPAEDAGAPVTAPVTPPVVKPSGGSIDGCCSAIAAVKKSGKDAIAKTKASSAAVACPGIAKRVKDGQTSRSDALTQIKSLLQGVSVPECN